MKKDTAANLIEAREIIARLRDPKSGCPWDLKQTHQSLKQYLIEECYETIEAIEKGEGLEEELGDVLLQILLHCQIASERSEFSLESVAKKLSDKLIRRHPHIFADTSVEDADAVLKQWEKIKIEEKAEKKEVESVLDGIPAALPALLTAHRLGEKTGRLGFDWDTAPQVFEKVREELAELEEACTNNESEKRVEEEFGDLLFALSQWGRKMKFNAELSLQNANRKFIDRFKLMEKSSGKPLNELTREEWEALWMEAKTVGKS